MTVMCNALTFVMQSMLYKKLSKNDFNHQDCNKSFIFEISKYIYKNTRQWIKRMHIIRYIKLEHPGL